MEAAKRVAKNTGILYARMAITVFISLYVTRLILDALGAQDYGIYSVIWGAVDMMTFINAAMVTTTQRFMSFALGSGDKLKQKHIFNVSITLHIIIAFLALAVLEIAGYFLFQGILVIPESRMPVAKVLFQFVLLTTFFRFISVPFDAVINAHENMFLVAVLGILEKVIQLLIALYVVFEGVDKLYTYGLLMLFIPIFISFYKAFYCLRKYDEVQINLKRYFDRPLLKEMKSFASLALLNSSAGIITMHGMSIVLNSVFGVIVNAAQGVSSQITGKLIAFSFTMLKALNPVIVKSEGGNNRVKMLKASTTGNKISYFLFAFMAIPVLIEMPYIMDIWLKNVPEYAIIFCRLSLLRLILDQLTVTFPTSIEATGNIKRYSYWNSASYMMVLPISYIAFKMGAPPYAIYILLLIMTLALSIIRIYFCHHICGLQLKDYFFNVVLRSLGTSVFTVFFAIIPILLMNQGLARLLTVSFVCILSFLSSLFLFGFQKDERKIINLVFKSVAIKLKIERFFKKN